MTQDQITNTEKQYLIEMGARIKAERHKKKLYVRDLAKMCSMNYANLSRTELGRHSTKILTLKRIAAALQIDVKDLI